MSNKLDEILRDISAQTFETLVFLFEMGDEEIDSSAAEETVAVSVGFSGPFGGAMVLSVTEPMMAEIAGNMLGEMDVDSLPVEQRNDGLKELANVLCGNLLPALAGDEAVFDVHAPELIDGKLPETVDGAPRVGHVRLNLDAGRAELALFAQGGVPALTEG